VNQLFTCEFTRISTACNRFAQHDCSGEKRNGESSRNRRFACCCRAQHRFSAASSATVRELEHRIKGATMISTVDYEALAAEAAGNWAKFDSFAWFEPPENPADVCIVYTSNRDSDIIDRANAKAIAAELAEFIESGDVRPESHSHWAVGHVDGYSIRVYTDDGQITAAFRTWCDIRARLENYPILDESLHSEMESEAQSESWDNWARSDYVRAVERHLEIDLDSSADLAEVFSKVCDRANVYWEGDSIDVDRVATATTCDDVRSFIVPVLFTVYRDGLILCRGFIIGDQWQCNLPIYDDQFCVCIEARDNGADFVNFGNQILTWRAE
jgi:hypothetical protein